MTRPRPVYHGQIQLLAVAASLVLVGCCGRGDGSSSCGGQRRCCMTQAQYGDDNGGHRRRTQETGEGLTLVQLASCQREIESDRMYGSVLPALQFFLIARQA